MSRVAPVAWALVVSACAGPASNTASVRAELEAVTHEWEASLLEGTPAAAVRNVFTEDAVRLPADEPPVRGHVAIADDLLGSAALEHASFDLTDIEVDGWMAFANGVYEVRSKGGEVLRGKFLEVWKRTEAGWRIHRVMWD